MTPEKIKQVIQHYRTLLVGMNAVPRGCDTSKLHSELKNPSASLDHCLYMIEKMEDFVDAGRLQKACRWLGYVQCTLYRENLCSIDQFKDDNRPD